MKLWLVQNIRNLVALASLIGLGVGFWLIHPGLGLIVPSGIVFASLAWTHTRNSKRA